MLPVVLFSRQPLKVFGDVQTAYFATPQRDYVVNHAPDRAALVPELYGLKVCPHWSALRFSRSSPSYTRLVHGLVGSVVFPILRPSFFDQSLSVPGIVGALYLLVPLSILLVPRPSRSAVLLCVCGRIPTRVDARTLSARSVRYVPKLDVPVHAGLAREVVLQPSSSCFFSGDYVRHRIILRRGGP